MNFTRPAASALLVSVVIFAGCERPEIGSERDTHQAREHRREESRETSQQSTSYIAQTRDIEHFESVELRVAGQANAKSRGHAVRIQHFLVDAGHGRSGVGRE